MFTFSFFLYFSVVLQICSLLLNSSFSTLLFVVFISRVIFEFEKHCNLEMKPIIVCFFMWKTLCWIGIYPVTAPVIASLLFCVNLFLMGVINHFISLPCDRNKKNIHAKVTKQAEMPPWEFFFFFLQSGE